jgi:SET domain-containing protein
MSDLPILPETWFDPRLELRDSPIHGRGLFATALIRTGETVMIWGGTLYTAQQLQDIRDGKLQVAEFSYSFIEEGILLAGPVDGLDYFINHACDPNIWMEGRVHVVARRDIQPGEELRGDYAVWECETGYLLEPCNCGSAQCRGRITGNDWMLPELQARYAGHFLTFIAQRIARQTSTDPASKWFEMVQRG